MTCPAERPQAFQQQLAQVLTNEFDHLPLVLQRKRLDPRHGLLAGRRHEQRVRAAVAGCEASLDPLPPLEFMQHAGQPCTFDMQGLADRGLRAARIGGDQH